MPFLIAALSLIALLAIVLVVRALMFKPKRLSKEASGAVFINADKAVSDLAEMIKCKTVSDRNHDLEDEAEFVKFKTLLPTLFPSVYQECEYIEVGQRAILLRWSGRSHTEPTVLMAHYDVVSADEKKWQKPPFEGIIENGVLWGRGTLDTKGTLNGILQAAETLIKEGFVPQSDIYFAFGGDEEINGHGASDIVELFRERGITPALVCDEGGAVVENIFPGVNRQCALIGIAEKGMLNVEYSVSCGGGHSSSPEAVTPIGRLSRACVALEKKPFKFNITPAAAQMFDILGRHSTFLYKLIFANLWFFSPLLNLITRKSGGELNAIVRTTVAFTQMEGSRGMNVIPPYARMASNLRLLPGDTKESALQRIRAVVADEKIQIREIDGMDPSVVSDTECEGYERIRAAVTETWQDAIVSPYLMFACSDSRHWGRISNKVYRFSAMALSSEERATIHGNDEKIPVGSIVKSVEFYIRLIKKC